MQDYEKLGVFYLGREYDAAARAPAEDLLLYDSRDLTTHAVCVGMLKLLKQGRAFGLGCVLATQNPVDLDYKGLGNAGTWMIGRLQTERDKLRVLDGLESAVPGSDRRGDLEAHGAASTRRRRRPLLLRAPLGVKRHRGRACRPTCRSTSSQPRPRAMR